MFNCKCLWEFDGCKGLFCKETNVSLKITYIDTYIRLLKPPPRRGKIKKKLSLARFSLSKKKPQVLNIQLRFPDLMFNEQTGYNAEGERGGR